MRPIDPIVGFRQLRRLERLLGRKIEEVEFLQEAIKSAKEKIALGRRLFQKGVWVMKRFAESFSNFRPWLSVNRQKVTPSVKRSAYMKKDKEQL